MSPMQRISTNFLTGSGGGALTWIGVGLSHYQAVLGVISATFGAVLVIFSAVNAINVWRDRRAAKRAEAEVRRAARNHVVPTRIDP